MDASTRISLRRSLPGHGLAAFLLSALLALRPSAASDRIDYTRDVKPLLARYCHDCHGPEEARAGLRLDTAASALAGGRAGPVVVPGNGAASRLVRALRGEGGLERMPYRRSPLRDEEIAVIRTWIDQGARAPEREGPAPGNAHWSFVPVVRPAVPSVRDPDGLLSPIDAFVLSRLDVPGIAPSPEADRVTLIRRLSFDILGLPPTPEEVDAFLADRSEDAVARLIDRLLHSPRFGERWGRHWLDLARYADSHGFTIDGPRSIWKYRDWVIDALNRDLPFDRFTIEQLAGDLVPGATLDQVVATGFHRNTLINQEGGTDQEQFRIDAVADRVDTTGSVFLGLTLGCARCHDHKYDPVTQEEYYRLFAFFNNADEPEIPVPGPGQERRLRELAARTAIARKALEEHDDGLAWRLASWERSLPDGGRVAWTPLRPVAYRSSGGAALRALEDSSLLARGDIPATDTYELVVEMPFDRVTALRLEALTHESLPRKGPGLAGNGNFVLSELRVSRTGDADTVADAASPAPVPIARVFADHSQKDYPAAHAIDGDDRTGWAINVARGRLNVDRRAVFVFEDPVPAAAGARLRVELVQSHGSRYQVGRFRLAATDAPAVLAELPDAVAEALAKPRSDRTAKEIETLRSHVAATDPRRQALASKLAAARREEAGFRKSIPTTLVLRERENPRETHVHVRGDFLRPGEQVEPGVPAVLPPLPPPEGAADRLELARWLVSPDHPLTARVTVNRVWQRLFGAGLVETENDFGTQGSRPSHPELLDWLAAEFVEGGWSLKRLLRTIALSAAYRRSSRARPDLAPIDPRNRLLARQNRKRLEAEIIRDAALAASGMLSGKIGGASVFPPQPEGIFRFTQSQRKWKESRGEDRFRRGMYTFFWRSSPYPFLTTFDAPDANVCCTRRVRSNTPLQSLAMANDRSMVGIARALAARILREGGRSDEERVRHAFRLCLSRSPTADEAALLRAFVRKESREAGNSEDAPWVALARALLNVDEFITRE